MSRVLRPRRSCLAVPGASPKMLKKAQTLASDQVFLDLEDSVAPSAKPGARDNIVEALNTGDWGDRIRTVRVNDFDTEWALDDVLAIVRGAGRNLDCIMLPKVESVSHIHWLDGVLTHLEKSEGLEVGRIGIEAQIEGPKGLAAVNDIAVASPRIECIIFGPGDFMAAMHFPALSIGASDAVGYSPFDGVLLQLAVAARANDLQVIDGPWGAIKDLTGYESAARRAADFGYDGKWVLHPGQIDIANEVYSPDQDLYDKSEMILDALEWATSEAGGSQGAVMLGDEMVDEASRKLALVTAERGRALKMKRTTSFEVPK